MANQPGGTVAKAIASYKRQKQALIKEFYDHCRNAPANHTAFGCQWCTDNRVAQNTLDNRLDNLKKQVEA